MGIMGKPMAINLVKAGYDVTVSKLANNTSGAHELSLGVILPCPEKKQRIKAIRCPSF